MTDPFNQNSDARRFIREAQVGLLIIALMLGFFAYVAYYRIEQYKSQLPQYVIDAPVAELVDPDTYLRGAAAEHLVSDSNGLQVAQISAVPETSVPLDPPAPKASNKKHPKGNPHPLESDSADAIANLNPDRSPPTEAGDAIYDNRLSAAVALENNSTVESKVVKATQFEPVLRNESQRTAGHNPSAFDIADKVQFTPNRLKPVPTDDSTRREMTNRVVGDQNGFQPKRRLSNQLSPVTTESQPPEPDEFTKTLAVSAKGLNDGPPALAAQPSMDAPADVPQLAGGSADRSETESTSQEVTPAPETAEPDTSDMKMSSNCRDGESLAADLASHSPCPYTVNPGDSYWSIAQELYGDGRFFRALFEHNRSRLINFENLDAGTELNAPAVDLLLLRYPDLCPADKVDSRTTWETVNEDSNSVYETRQGDTLFDVARKQLGQASRYLEILQLNDRQLPSNVNHLSRLRAGIKLDLPQ